MPPRRFWLALVALCPVVGLGAGLLRADVGFGVAAAACAFLLVGLSLPVRWAWLDFKAWRDNQREAGDARRRERGSEG